MTNQKRDETIADIHIVSISVDFESLSMSMSLE